MKKMILFFALFLLSISLASAQIPTISSYLTDKAGALSATSKIQLENDLRDLEKQTNGVQFVVYIENEYPKDYSLEEYTLKIAEQNKIGKKGNDNGILLYIAIKDKKYRWETGYGVEGTLNAALLGRISRDYLVPNFKNGDYEKGILQAADVVKRLLLNSSDADIAALKTEEYSSTSERKSIILFIIGMLVLAGIFAALHRAIKKSPGYKKRDDKFFEGAAWGLFMGGFGRGGFGGGGSGGFGGFSGGGGGFGGGGFSGRF